MSGVGGSIYTNEPVVGGVIGFRALNPSVQNFILDIKALSGQF